MVRTCVLRVCKVAGRGLGKARGYFRNAAAGAPWLAPPAQAGAEEERTCSRTGRVGGGGAVSAGAAEAVARGCAGVRGSEVGPTLAGYSPTLGPSHLGLAEEDLLQEVSSSRGVIAPVEQG